MMWRFKLFIFFILLHVVPAHAQREADSVFYLKFASPIDYLLQPVPDAPEYMEYARDSSSYMQHAAGKSLITSVKETDFTAKKPAVMQETYRYRFNPDGQISFIENREADSSIESQTNYIYLPTGEISMILKKKARYRSKDSVAYNTDTIACTYNRAGQLVSWCENRECIQRLYNSRQQLIVKRNALYGYMRGDYTYQYDDKGRLVQRRFLEAQSGVVLFIDTVQYSFVNKENTILSQKHYIRIAGKSEWTLFDELLLDTVHRNVLEYSLYYNTMRSARGIYTPGTLVYTYDKNGKLLSKRRDDKRGIEERHYAHYSSVDTVRTYRIVYVKEAIQKTLSSETIIVYDPYGLIASVKRTDYSVIDKRRKASPSVSMIREEEFHWK